MNKPHWPHWPVLSSKVVQAVRGRVWGVPWTRQCWIPLEQNKWSFNSELASTWWALRSSGRKWFAMNSTVILVLFNQCFSALTTVLLIVSAETATSIKDSKMTYLHPGSWVTSTLSSIKLHHGAEVGPSLLYFIYELAVVLIQNHNTSKAIHYFSVKFKYL